MGSVRYHQFEQDNAVVVEEIHEVVVHRFRLGDVEDPDLYAAQPLWEWQKSEAGQFVMKNAVETPEWRRQADNANWGYQYIIVAELEKKKLSEFYLRFDKTLKL
jgi:hypothetical protein